MSTQTTYPELFTKAVKQILAAEGGYVEDPNDAGGETNYGISKRQYPHLNILRLTVEDAIAIYYRDYWLAYRCDELPPAYACFLFDSVINHRPKDAIKFLQLPFSIQVDGVLGKQTIGALKQFANNSDYVERKLSEALSFRADFYHDLAVAKPSQERFIMGWLRRLFVLQRFILNEVNHGAN